MKRAFVSVLLLLALALLAAASVSWSPAVTLQITDAAGEPAPGAYVRYHYDTSILNFVDSLDRVARGSAFVRADADGTAAIPWRLHLRAPWPPTTPPEVFVDHVYVPRLHNASGPIPLRYGPHQAPLFQVDDAGRVRLLDASQDPELWERSLDELYDCIREAAEGRERMADPGDGSGAQVSELIRHFREEYAALLARYGDARRQRPAVPAGMSPEDAAEWTRRTDALLAREPLWGPRLERFWIPRLKRLEQLEGSLR